METTHLRFAGTVHAADAGSKHTTFAGMASVFNTMIDAYMPTRILPGAFTKTLADKEQRRRVKVLYQHDQEMPIGIPKVLREDARGLYIEGMLSNTERGKEAAQLLKDGVIDEMSIGFDPVRHTMVTENLEGMNVQVRHISEVRLWEVSLVTFGANREARITDVHRRQPHSGGAQAASDRMFELDVMRLEGFAARLGLPPQQQARRDSLMADFDRKQAQDRQRRELELDIALLDMHARRFNR